MTPSEVVSAMSRVTALNSALRAITQFRQYFADSIQLTALDFDSPLFERAAGSAGGFDML